MDAGRPVVKKSMTCVLVSRVVETYNAPHSFFLRAASFAYGFVQPSQPSSSGLLSPIAGH
jgi:hypothetical protein